MATPTPASANGIVTHLNTVMDMSGGGSTSVRTTHEVRFRVEGKPFALPGTYTVAEGDQVAVAGHYRGDVIRVVELKNFTTGTRVSLSPIRKRTVYGLLVVGVLLLPLFGIGLLFIALGLIGLRNLSRQNAFLKHFEQIARSGKEVA